jgi:hypothetical protein
MVIISIAVLLISLIYLLVGIYTQNELKQEQIAEIETAKDELEEAGNQFNAVSEPIFRGIADVYGQEYADEVESGGIEPGMPEEFMLLTLGDPEEIESSYLKGTNTERWYYDAVETGKGDISYKIEVVIINNRIVDIITGDE